MSTSAQPTSWNAVKDTSEGKAAARELSIGPLSSPANIALLDAVHPYQWTDASTEDVYELNNELITILRSIADTSLEKKSSRARHGRTQCSRRNKITAKNPWFDYDCIIARKLLNKATAKYNDDPTIESVRLNFYGLPEKQRIQESHISKERRILIKTD